MRKINFKKYIFAILPLLSLSLTVGCAGVNTVSSEDISLISIKPDAIAIVENALASDDPRLQVAAIEVIATNENMFLMPKVAKLLSDDYVPVRFAAAMAVGDTQYSIAKPKLEQLLKVADENTALAAAYSLYKLGDKKKIKVLEGGLKSQDQTVRANAVELTGKTGDKSFIGLIQRTRQLSDSDDRVKFQTLEALAALGDETVLNRLWAVVYSSYADDRVLGIRALGKLGTPKAKDILITKLDDELIQVRLAAAAQLGAMGDTTGEPEVAAVFSEDFLKSVPKEEQEMVKILAANAAGQVGTAQLRALLPAMLSDSSQFVRLAAARSIISSSGTKPAASEQP